MDEPGMGCRLASGSGGGEGKRGKQSILKCCSDNFTLLLDPELAPNPILMQTEFQQCGQGARDRGAECACELARAFLPLPTKESLWQISTLLVFYHLS